MSAHKHTPGPWLRDKKSGINCDVRAASGRKVALCWGLSAVSTNNNPAYRAECDANAVLISAAPELLAACMRLLVNVQWDAMRADIVTDEARADIALAKAAIAKAIGETT
jgi:hypothetical protein